MGYRSFCTLCEQHLLHLPARGLLPTGKVPCTSELNESQITQVYANSFLPEISRTAHALPAYMKTIAYPYNLCNLWFIELFQGSDQNVSRRGALASVLGQAEGFATDDDGRFIFPKELFQGSDQNVRALQ